MRVLSYLLVVLSLTGCVTTYVPPSQDGNATIEFRGSSIQGSHFYMFPEGRDCSGKAIIPAENNFHNPGAKPLIVAADREFAIMVVTVRWPKYCQVITSFAPRADANYVVVADNNSEHCSMDVFQREQSGSQSKLVPKSSQRHRTSRTVPPLLESGSFCKP